MINNRAYALTMFCSVCWYLCVLVVWVWIGRSMNLFGNHSPNGWIYIFLAFAASAGLNFMFNPFLWIVAGCFIRAAKEEGRSSKWSFYPSAIGIFLVSSCAFAVFSNFQQSKDVRFWEAARQGSGAKTAATHDSAPNELEVSGVMFAGEPSALVNGLVVKKGEHVDGYDVVEIGENSVTFRDAEGNEFVQRVR